MIEMIRVVRFTKNSKKIIDAKYRTAYMVHVTRYDASFSTYSTDGYTVRMRIFRMQRRSVNAILKNSEFLRIASKNLRN